MISLFAMVSYLLCASSFTDAVKRTVEFATEAKASVPNDGTRAEQEYGGPRIFTKIMAREKDRLTVDVFVEHVADLRGFQVALEVSGSDKGGWSVEDVMIDTERDNYVFAGLTSFEATDQAGGRIAGVLLEGGVDADKPAYVGTFIFRSTGDANGAPQVRVRLDEMTLLRDSDAKPIEFRVVSEPKRSPDVSTMAEPGDNPPSLRRAPG